MKNNKESILILIIMVMLQLLLSGNNAFAISIGDSPPEAMGKPAPPNFMIIMDDSGSMAWSTLNRGSSEGLFFIDNDLSSGHDSKSGGININDSYGDIYTGTLARFWRSKWCGPGKNTTNAPAPTYSSNYNALAYNPKIVYKPWHGMANADVSSPRTHPNDSDTWNLTNQHVSIGGISVKRRHYYRWSETDSKAYLVNLAGSISYYKVDGNNSGYITDSEIEAVASPPSDVVIKRDINNDGTDEAVTYEQEIQNFANWYQYHRTRWLSAVGAVTHMLSRFNGVKVGIYSIWGRINVPVVPIRVKNDSGVIEDQSSSIITPLTSGSATISGGTPLRRALLKVGQYYDTTDGSNGGIGTSPIASEAAGGACQQNYAMLFTDGYRNTDSNTEVSVVGNADNESTTFSGFSPYKDSYSYTLADVAMYYYKKDLSTTLANKVAENGPDKAAHQHMVTYTVGFGLDGQLVSSDYDISSPLASRHPVWPQPVASTLTTIDDLWHAAVNGRGDYISANDSKELEDAFSKVAEDVSIRAASAASVALNGTEVNEGLMVYQSKYNTAGWAGSVTAKKYPNKEGVTPATPDFSKTPSIVWNAASKLVSKSSNDRKIMTYNYETGQGVPFRYDNISPNQKTQLDTNAAKAQDILNYLRGDHSKEQRKGGAAAIYRNRLINDDVLGQYESKLGDIVHSAPAVADGVVYVGSNDGMLHAFRGEAAGGDELFAYVPNLVFQNLKDLSSPSYVHKYYVDQTPFVKKVGAEYYLVAGLGKGGKGVFCLNVTNAKSPTLAESDASGMVKWEYPSTPGSDPNMGYSFSKPVIVNTKAAGWVVVFGNGYNSVNGKAVLYIRKLSDGTEVKTIDTGVGSDNGLSTPNVVDINADGYADYVYAGDLKGNLWKFEINGNDKNNWALAYGTQPLFTAKDSSGNLQPITSRPEAMLHCKSGLPGYIVVFGTGKLLNGLTDNTDTSAQTVYGIWDYGDDADNSEYVGAIGSRASSSASLPYLTPSSLLKQSVEWTGDASPEGEGEMYDEMMILTANPIVWLAEADTTGQQPNPSKASPNHAGWYFDLPHSRERMINDVIIRDGDAIVVSSIPALGALDPCSPNGESWLYNFNACSGARVDSGVFDINNNSNVDDGDKVDAVLGGANVKAHVSGLHFSKLGYTPTFATKEGVDMMFIGLETDTATVGRHPENAGIFYWRSF